MLHTGQGAGVWRESNSLAWVLEDGKMCWENGKGNGAFQAGAEHEPRCSNVFIRDLLQQPDASRGCKLVKTPMCRCALLGQAHLLCLFIKYHLAI